MMTILKCEQIKENILSNQRRRNHVSLNSGVIQFMKELITGFFKYNIYLL